MLQTRDRQGFSAMTFTVRISPMYDSLYQPTFGHWHERLKHHSNVFQTAYSTSALQIAGIQPPYWKETPKKRCLLWSHDSHDVIQLRSRAQEFFKVPLIQPDKKTKPMRCLACHSCFQASPKTTIHSMHATSKFKKYENDSPSNWGNFWTCQSFLWLTGGIFFLPQTTTISDDPVRVEGRQLCGTIQSLKPRLFFVERDPPRKVIENLHEKAPISMFLNNPLQGTFFHLTNFFLASFSAWRPYKSDNKLQRPLKLHQHISGMEPNLFQLLQKPRPSTRPHHVPLAGQIHDVQPPQGWQSKFLRPIAEWTNPLNIFTSWDAMIVVSDPAPTDLVKIRNYIRFFNCSKWCRISSIHHPSRPQKMNQKYSKLVRTRWSQNPKTKTEGTRIISHHSETGEKLILKVVSWGISTSIICDFKISIKWPNMAQLELPQPFPAW